MNRRAFFSLVGAGFAGAVLPKQPAKLRNDSLIHLLTVRMETAGRRVRETLDAALFTESVDPDFVGFESLYDSSSNWKYTKDSITFDTASQTMLI